MFVQIWNMFLEYCGNGLPMLLFGVAFLYLLIAEKDRVKRIILLYTSLVIAVCFFCPLFAKVVFGVLDDETYYRILWLIPMTAVIAYGAVHAVLRFEKTWMRGAAILLIGVQIVLCGNYVYDNPYFFVAENRFHVPQVVADVCDAIIIPGREVRAVFPSNMLSYIRQYTANICMPYGREIMVNTWVNENPLFDAMEAEVVDCEKVASLAAEQVCHYVVLHETTKRKGNLEDYGYRFYALVDGFTIYQWEEADLSVPAEQAEK